MKLMCECCEEMYHERDITVFCQDCLDAAGCDGCECACGEDKE
jgi:hypothetical protein